jgi:hypothetical protein
MKYIHANAVELESPEVVLNLWAYVDEGGYIIRLAGKSYVMDADDDEKLALLRVLSRTDFLSANWCKVPANFKLINPDGKTMAGVATASMLSDPNSHSQIYSELFETLADSIPKQLRVSEDGYEEFRLELPQAPLCVTTVIMEYDDGRLIPMVSSD